MAAIALFCASLLPWQATAATIDDIPDIETEPLGEFSLSTLLREDPLGGDCIAEEDIDLAFFASGKGMRLPRTCLPDPCNEALTPFRLAELIGRPAQPPEWDLYFSRYADACRKEVVSFAEETRAPEPATKAEFWAPILGGRVVQGQLILPQYDRISVFGGAARRIGFGPSRLFGSTGPSPPSGGGGTPIKTMFGLPEDEELVQTTAWPGDDGADREWPAPSPVPLPLGAWMLLSALLGLTFLRRSRA